MTNLKSGTRIELHGTPSIGGFPAVAPELATIVKGRKAWGEVPDGYHRVKFVDGGILCVHETRFRIISNGRAR